MARLESEMAEQRASETLATTDRQTTIVTVGELLVEFVSHEKDCALERIVDYSGPYPSGAPAIFLDQAARMGASTSMVGCVGDDGFGRALLGRLRDDGVGIDAIQVAPDLTTGTAFVSYHKDGSRDFIFHLQSTAAEHVVFSPEAMPAGDLVLHVSASSLGPPALRAAILDAVEAVLDRGGRICCDPNARPELMRDDEGRKALEMIVAKSFCLMPSTSDLGFLFPGETEEAAIEHLLSGPAEIVAIKRGSDGASVVRDGERHDVPGHRVDEVDPTGAGDCFCGTLIALLLQGGPLLESVRLANAAGALAVTRRGPMEGNSSPDELTRFIESGTAPGGEQPT